MRITLDSIARCSTLQPKKNESQEEFCSRITCLNLYERGVERIENLSFCTNLTSLLLNDNNISIIEGLSELQNLEQLCLQNNQITKISGLSGLQKLSVLHLSGNRISYVEQLHDLPSLTHLHLDKQKLQDGECLSFDLECMQQLGETLLTFTVSSSNVSDIAPLAYLSQLKKLDVSQNSIDSWPDLEFVLDKLSKLELLNITFNPVCNVEKFRDKCTLACPSLTELNGKEVSPVFRQFLLRLKSRQKVPKPIVQEETIVRGVASDEKLYPHLPPYATQYRDLIQQQYGQIKYTKPKPAQAANNVSPSRKQSTSKN